jgi:ABC-type branched-subunit amino acid transport system substrate-binding protein
MKRTVFIVSIIVLMASCASMQRDRAVPSPDAEDSELMLTRIRTLAFEGDLKEIRKVGKQFLSRFGEDPAVPEVMLLVAGADVELGFFDEARQLALDLIELDADRRETAEAYLLLSEVERSRGLFSDAARHVLTVLAMEPDEKTMMRARSALEEATDLITPEGLDLLGTEYESSPGVEIVLESRLSYAETVGDTATVRAVSDRLAEIYARAPESAREPTGGRTVPVATRPKTDGVPKIGLLCPLSGRFSPVGAAFLEGASLAVKEALKRGSGGLELVVGDTRSNPLTARAAAERLIRDEKVLAIVGGVLSSPTIAAAQVAQYNKTVFVSPVATEDGISAIGEWIFQTSGETDAEVIAIARVACIELGLERIAFLAADNARSRALAGAFSREIELAGGMICSTEYYEEGSTDFRDVLERLRDSDPGGLFIASDQEDLVLILPQLSYYELGVQLLGTSSWHSDRLLRMTGRDMEGAVFPKLPSEAYDSELVIAAAKFVDVELVDLNTFVLGGYRGVRTVIEALAESGPDSESLRRAISNEIENRLHPYLTFVSGPGITFYRIRGERIEEWFVLK